MNIEEIAELRIELAEPGTQDKEIFLELIELAVDKAATQALMDGGYIGLHETVGSKNGCFKSMRYKAFMTLLQKADKELLTTIKTN